MQNSNSDHSLGYINILNCSKYLECSYIGVNDKVSFMKIEKSSLDFSKSQMKQWIEVSQTLKICKCSQCNSYYISIPISSERKQGKKIEIKINVKIKPKNANVFRCKKHPREIESSSDASHTPEKISEWGLGTGHLDCYYS